MEGVTVTEQDRLFEAPPVWAEHWEDMPEFKQGDERPHSSINVYFRTADDRQDFLKLLGAEPNRSRGLWYPFRRLPRESTAIPFDTSKVLPNRYPVYVISKGRAGDKRATTRALDNLGMDYRLVVEPQERSQYAAHLDEKRILELPFQDLGQGSIPARNWVWNHAVESGAAKHWILDDNIENFARVNQNKTRIVKDENPLLPCEEFVDRYRNVGLAGLQYRGFADDKTPNLAPYRLNTRVYSCILINHAIPFRWRGRYNEDTDLSLRVLKQGWVTVLFHSYLIDKVTTMRMSGGNTDELYAGNGRLKMAESLQVQHPDVVTITEKWGRPQHHVDYLPFKENKLIPKTQLTLVDT